jgi:hypothetical protein
MNRWIAARTNALAVVIAVAWLPPCVAFAQAPGVTARPATSTRATAQTPRTPWGDPDFQGTWTTDDYIGVPIQRPADLGDKLFLTEAEWNDRAQRQQQVRQAAQAAGGPVNPAADTGPPDHWGERPSRAVRQTSFVVWPADGRIPPVTPEAQKRAAPRDTGSFGGGPFNTFTDFTNFDRCITRAVVGSILPRPYGNGLDIVQSPGYVALRHEMIHEPRVIPIDAGPHIGSGIRQYMGDSRGHWEGDVLVVETTNFTDKTSIGFNGNGLRHSEAMRHVERFTRVDADTIKYEVTIEDAKTYTAPFKIGLAFTTQPGYQVFEYACHEGNYGMPNILSGARADEAAAKK